MKSHFQLDKEYDDRTMRIFRTTEQYISKYTPLKYIHRMSYKNFVRILINLYKVKHRYGKITLVGVRAKMEKMAYISDKKWLLEKMEEIENKTIKANH